MAKQEKNSNPALNQRLSQFTTVGVLTGLTFGYFLAPEVAYAVGLITDGSTQMGSNVEQLYYSICEQHSTFRANMQLGAGPLGFSAGVLGASTATVVNGIQYICELVSNKE